MKTQDEDYKMELLKITRLSGRFCIKSLTFDNPYRDICFFLAKQMSTKMALDCEHFILHACMIMFVCLDCYNNFTC